MTHNERIEIHKSELKDIHTQYNIKAKLREYPTTDQLLDPKIATPDQVVNVIRLIKADSKIDTVYSDKNINVEEIEKAIGLVREECSFLKKETKAEKLQKYIKKNVNNFRKSIAYYTTVVNKVVSDPIYIQYMCLKDRKSRSKKACKIDGINSKMY